MKDKFKIITIELLKMFLALLLGINSYKLSESINVFYQILGGILLIISISMLFFPLHIFYGNIKDWIKELKEKVKKWWKKHIIDETSDDYDI